MNDITHKENFVNLEDWLKEIRKYLYPEVTICLVENMLDLVELIERWSLRRVCEIVYLPGVVLVSNLKPMARKNKRYQEAQRFSKGFLQKKKIQHKTVWNTKLPIQTRQVYNYCDSLFSGMLKKQPDDLDQNNVTL